MINAILLEDHRSQFEKYKHYIAIQFNEVKLLNDKYIKTYEGMETFVAANIHRAHIIIADISLDQTRENDISRWSPQLLSNISKDEEIAPLIRRRGIAVAFMTAFIQEQYDTVMRTNFPGLFNSRHIFQTALRKGHFLEDIAEFIRQFKQEFVQTSEHSWVRNSLLNGYIEEFGQQPFPQSIQLVPLANIQINQVVAMEKTPDGDWVLWFERGGVVEKANFEASKETIIEAFRLWNITNGRLDNAVGRQQKAQFEQIAPTVHFLHIANRPIRIINARKNWIYKGETHGKEFTLAGTEFRIKCTFDTYNDWIKNNPFFEHW